MAWPAWSIEEPAALARYVVPAERVKLDIVRDDAIRQGARWDLVRAIYNAMLRYDFHYSRERWSPDGGPQVIRDPDEIFEGGNATCLDLALLFAGVCLGHELLPLVVIVEGHAFVVVSLLDDPRDPASRARVEHDGDWVDGDGVLEDAGTFARLIAKESGHYVPVECTGFAKTELSHDGLALGAVRTDGMLDFESAVAAARSECAKRRFMFAVDPALRQRVKRILPHERGLAAKQIAQELRSLFPEIELEKQSEHEREFEQSYLTQIRVKYRRLETPGVPELKDFRQPLTLAYISLFVKQSQMDGETGRKQAEHVLEAERLLTVRAPAGAGKTTLLNWIALACAQDASAEVNRRWRGGVPFFIPLRALQDGGTPDLSKFVDYTVDLKQWPASVPPGWVVRVLQGKRAVIMLDGVDELSSKNRPDFWKWLKDELIQRYPGNRIIITSRYMPESRNQTANWQPPRGFASADLDEMTDEDVGQFVRRWHDSALETEADPIIRAELVTARDALPGKLADPVNQRVRQLCGTPLLCSMICALHLREEGYLPARRIELYERCVAMLIEERDQKRGIENPEGPLRWITKPEKEMILQRIAYQMMKNVVVDEEARACMEIGKEQAVRWIGGWIPNFRDTRAREADPSELLAHLIVRTTLIRSPVFDTIEFSHRSFQEYLAACAAGAADDAVDLANRANDDQWHEIIILAAGTRSGGIPFGNELIQALLKGGKRWNLRLIGADPHLRHTYFALAIGCLETAWQPDPEIRRRALGHLKDIVPPRNVSAAKNLAAAGEAALSHLGYDKWKGESDETVVSCARAVRLIGGATATRMLIEGFGCDKRDAVLTEVARGHGVSVFDIPTIRQTLSNGKSIPIGLRHFVKDLAAVASWYNETSSPNGRDVAPIGDSLDLSCCGLITDLTPLAILQGLKSLNLSRTGIRDLKPIRSLTKIRRLRLRDCEMSDVTPLGSLQSLEKLDLGGCEKIMDVSPLASLQGLTSLGLDRCRRVTDLTPLASLQNLGRLHLGRSIRITDITPLASLRNLTRLNLDGCHRIADLSPLGGLQASLRSLALSIDPSLDVLRQVQTLKRLRTLRLRRWGSSFGNPESDLEVITSLTRLERLELWNWDGVKELPPLKSLRRLRRLEIVGWRCPLDLRSLMPLTNLRVLNLSRCEKLTDLGPLRALTNLRMLSIAGIDNIVDFAPLMEMKLSVILVEPKLLNLLPPELKLRAKVARRTGRSGISSIPVTEFQASRATRNGHDVP